MRRVANGREHTYHKNADIELCAKCVNQSVYSELLKDFHTLRHMAQPTQELIELLLPIRQLATPTIVNSKQRHDAVDNQEAVFVRSKRLVEGVEKLELVLAVLCTRVKDVFAGAFGID